MTNFPNPVLYLFVHSYLVRMPIVWYHPTVRVSVLSYAKLLTM